MPSATRAAANLIVTENGAVPDDPNLLTHVNVYALEGNEDFDVEPPPDISHEGGEVEAELEARAAVLHVLDP